MTDILLQYGLFFAQAVTIVIAIGITLMIAVGLIHREHPDGMRAHGAEG